MKKFLVLFISALFISTLAIADNITINWGIDNQLYTTTTCTVGGDVILPSISKRGHVFRGWQPEHFDRGTFANWEAVPNSNAPSLYTLDKYNNRYPLKNDTIIVNDASDYVSTDFTKDLENIAFRKTVDKFSFNMVIGEDRTSHSYQEFLNTWVPLTNTQWISLKYVAGAPGYYYLKSDIAFYVDNEVVQPNVQYLILSTNDAAGTIHYVSNKQTGISPIFLQGTWRFVYDGVWETDGKNGWKPDVQISNSNE